MSKSVGFQRQMLQVWKHTATSLEVSWLRQQRKQVLAQFCRNTARVSPFQLDFMTIGPHALPDLSRASQLWKLNAIFFLHFAGIWELGGFIDLDARCQNGWSQHSFILDPTSEGVPRTQVGKASESPNPVHALDMHQDLVWNRHLFHIVSFKCQGR